MRRLLVGVALAALVCGCGGSVEVSSKPDKLSGELVAKKANAQLEKENPQMTPGKLTCEDVAYEKGATTRCLRTVDLGQGRRVMIGATVEITGTSKGGRFSVLVDKQVKEFGQTGETIEQDLATQYTKRFGGPAPQVACPPYLKGVVGTTINCELKSAKDSLDIQVKVDRVDTEELHGVLLLQAGLTSRFSGH